MTHKDLGALALLIACLSILLILSTSGHRAFADAAADASTLEDLIVLALESNPDIQIARAGLRQREADVPQATAWPDPRLNLRYFPQEIETRAGPQVYALGVSQAIPWPDGLKFQGEAASHRVSVAKAQIYAMQRRVRAGLGKLWTDLSLATQSIAILAAKRELLASLESTLRARYATATTDHPDLIRSQIALGEIENLQSSLLTTRTSIIAEVNAYLQHPPAAKLPDPPPLTLLSETLPAGDAQGGVLLRALEQNHPSLHAMDAAISAAEAALGRARLSALPQFSLGFDYTGIGDDPREQAGAGSGRDALSLSLSVTLPLAKAKYRGEAQGAEAHIDAVRAARRRELHSLAAAFQSSRAELLEAKAEAERYRDRLIPAAGAALQALLASYASDQADFAEVIAAKRLLLELELAEVRTIARHNKAQISVEELIGARP